MELNHRLLSSHRGGRTHPAGNSHRKKLITLVWSILFFFQFKINHSEMYTYNRRERRRIQLQKRTKEKLFSPSKVNGNDKRVLFPHFRIWISIHLYAYERNGLPAFQERRKRTALYSTIWDVKLIWVEGFFSANPGLDNKHSKFSGFIPHPA